MLSGVAAFVAMEIVSVALAEACAASRTLIPAVWLPADVGVPEITPVLAFNCNPAANAPEELQV
jgi:hypothetical protein